MKSCRKARRGARRPGGVRLYVEPLESRSLLSAASGLPLLVAHPNDTLDQAADLGALSAGNSVQATGIIGDSPAGAADVDWYQFTLDQPLEVTLRATNPAGGQAAPVALSLYNSDPLNFTDPSMLLGNRLLARDQATANNPASIDRPLAAGTYDVAVSGAGNLYFHPFLAGSGYDGQTGPFTLSVTGTDLGIDPTVGPSVLTSDPAPGAVLNSSPPYLHVDLSSALDTGTTPVDQIVQLTYSPDGQFDGSEPVLPLAATQYSPVTNEILVVPSGPLAPGYYTLSLVSPDGSAGGNAGAPADFTTPQPWQQSWSMTFQVAGIEGNTGAGANADDTPAGAHPLGDITKAGLVQATGYIGDDPTAPPRTRPAADVDLYHFQVSGPGQYALTAEAFASRIGSPLNPALSLFRLDPTTNRLELLAANDDTLNSLLASDGRSAPLRKDAALFAGLAAGDYYLAVSSSKNMPNPAGGPQPGQLVPGVGRIFDPNVSHSGTAGATTGGYVLNLLVQAEEQPPRVLAATPADGGTLNGPPTELQITFSKPVNLQQLAYRAFLNSARGAMPAVFITATDGTRYSPRFGSFDPVTNVASLSLLDALPNGAYELHLSGAAGLTDMAGHSLVGNDPSGDYLVRLQVAGPPRGTSGDPLTWDYVDSDAAPVHVQALGVLFPDELTAGVNVVRQPAGGAVRPQQADAYDFKVLQYQRYLFSLSGADLPAGAELTLLDANGASVADSVASGTTAMISILQPGSYRVVIQGWTADRAAGVGYQLTIKQLGKPDSPVPLTSGPAPAIRLRLQENITPPVPTTPPPSTSGGSAIQAPPRLTLSVVEQNPDSAAASSSLQVNWASGAGAPGTTPQTGAGADKLVGPVLVGLPGPSQANTTPATSEGASGVVPAVRVTVPESAGSQTTVSIPFNLLAVLGTSPAGTPLATNGVVLNGPPPRLILQLPDAAATDGLLRLMIFSPLILTGGEEHEPSPEEGASAPAPAPLSETRAPVSVQPEALPMDAWFSRLGWLDWDAPGRQAQLPRETRPVHSDWSEGDEEALGLAWEDAGRDEPVAREGPSWALALCVAAAGVNLQGRWVEDDRARTWVGKGTRKER